MPIQSQALMTPASPLRAALIGRCISRSRTPAMHAAEARVLGLEYVYEIMDLDCEPYRGQTLAQVLDKLQSEGYAGVNITYPFKSKVTSFLDELSDDARFLGAVNTVVFQDGKRIGHNTDLTGFAEAFRQDMADVSKDHVLLLGAGGAGNAVALALVQGGVRSLSIYDQNMDRARGLEQKIKGFHPKIDVRAFETLSAAIDQDVCGVVNATTKGMDSYPGSAFPRTAWAPDMWAVDIVYFPLKTQFLADAENAGCRIMSGAGMAIHQAVHAFELITGHKGDADRFTQTFHALNESAST